MNTSRQLTAERALELLLYSRETGVITRRVGHRTAKAGSVAGSLCKNGYLYASVDGRKYLCHRLAWLMVHGVWPDSQIDHINGCRSDNRIGNLRAATNAENHQNRGAHSRNTSGRVGVVWRPSCKGWVAQICVSGRTRYLGLFKEKDDAAAAYSRAKEEFHSFNPTVRAAA